MVCSNDPPNGQKGFTIGAIVTIVILSLLGFLVFIGTIIDLILLSRIGSANDINSHINGYNHLIDAGTTEIVSIKPPQYSRQASMDATLEHYF